MNPQFKRALFVPSVLSFLMVLIFFLEQGMNWDFHQAGIYPGKFYSLGGVITMIFVHADWSHLLNNVISFFFLSVCLFYFYHEIAAEILLWSVLLTGIILWIVGRQNWHIGASGVIYALVFFLFFSGIIRKHVPLIAISLVIIFLYGGMVWHIFPWKVNDPISWEGHLSGGITGVLLSVIFRKHGPQKPEMEDDETDEDVILCEENSDSSDNGC